MHLASNSGPLNRPKMRRRTGWLIVAAVVAATSAVAADKEYDHSKKMREEHRRNLPQYIEQLHSPATQASPYYYSQLVLWIANSDDPRATKPLIEVLSDSMPRLTADAQLTAAEFLGRRGVKRAIPILKQNLTMERRFGPPGESARFTPVWNRAVHVGAAAALFQMGELQAALPVFRSLLTMGDSDSRGIPSNAFRVTGTPIDAYANRPRALDTIYRFFREATVSGNPELRAGAALRLVGIDTELAFKVANEVLALSEPESSIHRHIGDTRLPAGRAAQIEAIRSYRVMSARVTAVYVLKAIGDARTKELLKTLAHDPSKSVRVASDFALRELERKK
jgi:HEAT repeat protein